MTRRRIVGALAAAAALAGGGVLTFSGGGQIRRMAAITPNPYPAQTAVPSSFSLPVVSGTATQGSTLTGTLGLWNQDPRFFAYAWQDCNSGGTGCVASTSGNGIPQPYTLGAGDVGDTIRLAITATNSKGSTTASSAATAVVAASGGGGPQCSPSPCTTPTPVTNTMTGVDDGAGTILTNRTYQLYRPGNLTNSPSHLVPLVVLYGGGGGATDWQNISAADKFVLLNLGNLNSSLYYNPNDIVLPDALHIMTCGPSGTGACDDTPAVAEMLREVEATQNIDPNQVFSVGASKGGAMTNSTLCEKGTSSLFTGFSAMSITKGTWSTTTAHAACPAVDGENPSWVPGTWTNPCGGTGQPACTCGTWNGTSGTPTNTHFSHQFIIGTQDPIVEPQPGINQKGCWTMSSDQFETVVNDPANGCSTTPTASTIGTGTPAVSVNTYTGCNVASQEMQTVFYPCNCHAYAQIDGQNGIANSATVQWNFLSSTAPSASRPSVPTGVSAVVSGSQVNVSWTAGSGDVTYFVYRDGKLIGTTTGTSWTDTGAVNGLNSGTTYTYYLVALNSSGWASGFSSTATATP